MKKIELKNNDALGFLISQTGKTKESLEERIFGKLIKEELLDVDDEECIAGMTIFKIFEEIGGQTNKTAITLFLLDKATKEFIEIMDGITVWGKANECPLCGCELEKEGEYSSPDWEDGHVDTFWEDEYCTNPYCEYRENIIDNDPVNYCTHEKC